MRAHEQFRIHMKQLSPPTVNSKGFIDMDAILPIWN